MAGEIEDNRAKLAKKDEIVEIVSQDLNEFSATITKQAKLLK